MSRKLQFLYLFVFIATVAFNIYFYLDQQDHLRKMQCFTAREQAKALDGFIRAFRQTYQQRFLQDRIPLNEENIKLLPVTNMAAITQKFSTMMHRKVSVRTVSDRPRDPRNRAEGLELESIRYFRAHPKKRVFYRMVEDEKGARFFYASALYVSAQCLKCHGKKEEAPAYIRQKFDRAYGYHLGELRGVIAVSLSQTQMKKNLATVVWVNVGKIVLGSLIFLVAFYFLLRRYAKKEEVYTRKLKEEVAQKTAALEKKSDQLRYRLYHDDLTGLPNRHALLETLERAATVSLVLINVDDFNEINDFYGHEIGDVLILQLANFLRERYAKEGVRLYRMPSDEFALLYDNLGERAQLEAEIQRVVEGVHDYTFLIEGEDIHLRVAAGASMEESDVLITADMAMKWAKTKKRDWVVFDHSLNIGARYRENIAWAERLKKALDEDRIVPYFQPIKPLDARQPLIYEALIRLVESDGTVHMPGEFLEIAKKTRYYPRLTLVMARKVFEAFENLPYHVSLNLSYLDLMNAETLDRLTQMIASYGMVERLHIEILESEGIERFDELEKSLQRFRSLGVKVSLDDFGSGYSNFINVANLDFDILKIDGTLIRQIHHDISRQITVETIVDFAKKLNIRTCAEFVGSAEVLEIVREMGVDYVQGFYLGEPKPADDLV